MDRNCRYGKNDACVALQAREDLSTQLLQSHVAFDFALPVLGTNGGGAVQVLVLCNVTNKIRKRTDSAVAFTQEYSRVLYPLRNVST